MCPYGECNGHYSSPTPSSDNILVPLDICMCKSRDTTDDSISPVGSSCSCTSSDGVTCNKTPVKKCHVCDKDKEEGFDRSLNKNCRKCNTANTLALDNSKTKCKLDQLRLVMQQKKQRREARKMKVAPYPVSTTNTVNITQTEQPSVITEEIETVA